ncbi:MAG: hypothetical protein JNM84_03130 [Planctomycetes bacterium]|nr:hypothetical protein [Planctomycetota bacterium]
MESECPECGSDLLVEVVGSAGRLLECGLCGELCGDDALVGPELLRREARDRGLDPRVHDFARRLEIVPGLRIDRVVGGDAREGTWPTVFFHLGPVGFPWLEPLTQSLALATHGAKLRWSLELQYQHRLELLFRPRLLGERRRFSAEEIEDAYADLDRCARALERDRLSSWWRPAFRVRGT